MRQVFFFGIIVEYTKQSLKFNRRFVMGAKFNTQNEFLFA